ncbi:MAG: alpha/beta fold hydrolase [Erysipelotrichaceae bacterium]
MQPFALKTYRMYSEKLDRDVEITVFSSGNNEEIRPLILMHDGQNLFFDKLATYGTCWGLLDVLAQDDFPACVLVGMTCGEDRVRMDEYGPFVFSDYAQRMTGYDHPVGGKGDAHLRFVFDELIPSIRADYHVEEKVYLGGSSLGGVIVLYAALAYPDKVAGIFGLSNAFWVSLDPFIAMIEGFQGALPRIYLDLGDRESDDPVESQEVLRADACIVAALRAKNPAAMRHESIAGGTHNEASWRLRIAEILRWILKK